MDWSVRGRLQLLGCCQILPFRSLHYILPGGLFHPTLVEPLFISVGTSQYRLLGSTNLGTWSCWIFSRLFPCNFHWFIWFICVVIFLSLGAPLVLRLAGVPRQFWVDWRPLGGPKELRGVWQGHEMVGQAIIEVDSSMRKYTRKHVMKNRRVFIGTLV